MALKLLTLNLLAVRQLAPSRAGDFPPWTAPLPRSGLALQPADGPADRCL